MAIDPDAIGLETEVLRGGFKQSLGVCGRLQKRPIKASILPPKTTLIEPDDVRAETIEMLATSLPTTEG